MSLWSPVDLVTGGSGTRTISSSSSSSSSVVSTNNNNTNNSSAGPTNTTNYHKNGNSLKSNSSSSNSIGFTNNELAASASASSGSVSSSQALPSSAKGKSSLNSRGSHQSLGGRNLKVSTSYNQSKTGKSGVLVSSGGGATNSEESSSNASSSDPQSTHVNNSIITERGDSLVSPILGPTAHSNLITSGKSSSSSSSGGAGKIQMDPMVERSNTGTKTSKEYSRRHQQSENQLNMSSESNVGNCVNSGSSKFKRRHSDSGCDIAPSGGNTTTASTNDNQSGDLVQTTKRSRVRDGSRQRSNRLKHSSVPQVISSATATVTTSGGGGGHISHANYHNNSNDNSSSSTTTRRRSSSNHNQNQGRGRAADADNDDGQQPLRLVKTKTDNLCDNNNGALKGKRAADEGDETEADGDQVSTQLAADASPTTGAGAGGDQCDAPLNLCMKKVVNSLEAPRSTSSSSLSSSLAASHNRHHRHHHQHHHQQQQQLQQELHHNQHSNHNVYQRNHNETHDLVKISVPSSSVNSERILNPVPNRNEIQQQHFHQIQQQHHHHQQQQQQQHHQPSSRRRGRKPKSILAGTGQSHLSGLPIIVVPATTDEAAKPRRRGRPPLLSPPLIQPKLDNLKPHQQQSQLPPISQNSFPGALTLTSSIAANAALLQSGWPSFTSSGLVMFPGSMNGGTESKQPLSQRGGNCKQQPPPPPQPPSASSLQVDHSDANSMVSGEDDSKRGETDSEEDNDEDSDSMDSQQSNKDDPDSKKMSHVSRLLPDEKEIRVPLNYGWRRQTVIRVFSRSGVRGDVIYFAPCGKKMKSYPEVIRYLQKSNISEITRDNFSYSSKLIVGEFLEPLPETNNDYQMLTEDEVKQKIAAVRASGRRRLGIRGSRGSRRRVRRTEEPRIVGRDGQEIRNDHYQQPPVVNFGSHTPRDGTPNSEMYKSRVEEDNKREAEILKRVQERELRKYQAEIQKEQEAQRRRELQVMAEIERERRKQHILLVRALDNHKKQEERERKREEMMAEKRLLQERKLQKKRLEMELLKELKKPVDDMMLKDQKALPTYNRIPGLKLPAKAFADILMVYEFLHNFGETLGFDMDSLPTLNTLQSAVLNLDETAEEELLSIMHHLLVCVIDDPGLPCNVTTIMGQKLKDAPITNYNITEILRLYFQSFVNSQARNGDTSNDAQVRVETKLYNVLKGGKPYLSLNVTFKAEILAFLCDELLCNQAIVRQIEDNIESVANLRRDKWVVETDLRRYKSMKQKREAKASEDAGEEELKGKEEKSEGDNIVGGGGVAVGGGGNGSDSSDAEEHIVGLNGPDEEPGLSNEDLDKKIESLSRKCTMVTNKLNKAVHGLRVPSLGQDRYRRRYWTLPSTGGLFVEGLESAEPEELATNCNDDDDDLKDEEEAEEEEEDEDGEAETDKEKASDEKAADTQKIEMMDQDEDKTESTKENTDIKMETDPAEVTEDISKPVKNGISEDGKMNPSDEGSKNVESKHAEAMIVEEDKANVPKEDKVVEPDEKMEKDSVKLPEASLSGQLDNQWFSPIMASVLAGSMMFGNNSNHSINNGFNFPFNFQMDMGNSLQPKQTQRPWFSILPRMPCCKETLVVDPSGKSKPTPDLSSVDDKEKSKPEIPLPPTGPSLSAAQLSEPDLNQSQFGSLISNLPISNLPTNLFMQAFLYPHLLGSLFQHNKSSNGEQCNNRLSNSSTGPISAETNPPEAAANSDQQLQPQQQQQQQQPSSVSQSRPSSPSMIAGKLLLDLDLLNTQFTDIDICPSLQKKLQEQRDEQYNEPQKIPAEFQRGWWRITDVSQLKQIIEALHERGARERQLHKYLSKHFNYVSAKCKALLSELDITDTDREIAEQCPYGAPLTPEEDVWYEEVALKLDIAVLEQVEMLEEKIATSSMQVRGWRPPTRKSNDDIVQFKLSRVYSKRQKLEASLVNGQEDDDEDEEEEVEDENSLDSESGVNPVKVGRERLLAAEAVIERRYLKPPLGYKSNTHLAVSTLSHHNSNNSSDEYADNAADENAPNGLLRWREAVRECETGSELALLLHFLESCIAWDKSIMRASCQFCGSGENEAQLLLCDGCDKGYHTYCFKPKMETIPDGDWFCYECQNKNTIDKVCIVCGKKGKLLNCDTCPKVFHPNCLDPPVTKPPKGKWSCNMCNRKPKKPKYSRKSSTGSATGVANVSGAIEDKSVSAKEASVTEKSTSKENKRNSNSSKSKKESKSEPVEKETKETKKEKKAKEKEKDKEINQLEAILTEMEKHEDSWPFLLPVNTKQFPTYKKIIKKPMDLTFIRNKLEIGGYKSKAEFINDCRLIFDNCETFNEDESPVGIAGHNMRKFFDKLTKDLL